MPLGWSGAGTLGVPLEGTRRFRELLSKILTGIHDIGVREDRWQKM